MKEIALLPDSLLRTSSVGLVNRWYEQSFEEVVRYENMELTPSTLETYEILRHDFLKKLVLLNVVLL